MIHPRKSLLLLIPLLFVPLSSALGSTGELDRVITEAQRLRSLGGSVSSRDQFGKELPESLADFKAALRDWIEADLPISRAGLDLDLAYFQHKKMEELRQANLLISEQDHYPFGYVTNLEILRPEEFPEAIIATVGVSVPCGHDDAVYGYRFDGLTRQRFIESHDSGTYGKSISEIAVSRPDEDGNRLMFIARYGVQCASCWNGLSYKILRLGRAPYPASAVLEGHHDLYICSEYHVKLEPNQFLIELRDRSIDTGILIRTHILNYRIDRQGAHRVEPFALQIQDFVDEWLTRPWDEIAKTSDVPLATTLEKWHQTLHSDYVHGEYEFVQQCASKPGQTQVAVDLDRLAGKELPEPLTVYFIVKEEKDYRFKMLDISFTRQDGCLGESFAKPDSPSLFQPIKKNGSDSSTPPTKSH